MTFDFQKENMPINSIGVHIKVKDFDASKAFYEALQFTKVFEYGPDMQVKEAYRGATFQHGTAKIEIADGHRAVKPDVFKETVGSSKISLMIAVDSLTDILEKCTKANIPISVKPRHYYWGTLELVIKDPDGVVLVFIAPYSKQEAKEIGADEKYGITPNK